MTGRGAWPKTGRGGTLTLDGKPGPYYAYHQGAPIVGSGGTGAPDLDRRAVAYGVRSIQAALNWHAGKTVVPVDGLYGPATAAAIASTMARLVVKMPFIDHIHPPEPAGVVGQGAAYHLFAPIVDAYAQDAGALPGVPRGVAHGVVELESAWDPGAVGYSTPQDLGLAQWRTPLEHAGVMVDEAFAFDIFKALKLLVTTLAAAYASYGLWELAVAHHHAPAWADDLAATMKAWPAGSPLGRSRDYINYVLNHAR